MGGYGSGQWYRWDTKTTIEETQRLDVRLFHKRGWLRPGYGGSLTWHRGERRTGAIGFSVTERHLVLTYQYQREGEAWTPMTWRVVLDWTPCHYGGQRPWFLCPPCGKRVGVLCRYQRYFVCRICARLPYASQQQGAHDRLMTRLQKIRQRLGGPSDFVTEILFKPKHMHWRTFERLKREEDRLMRAHVMIMHDDIERMIGAFDKSRLR